MKTILIEDIAFIEFQTGVEVTSIVNYLSWSKYMFTKLYQAENEQEVDEVTGETIDTPTATLTLNHPAIIQAFNQLDYVLRVQMLNRPMIGQDREYAANDQGRPTIFANRPRAMLIIHGENLRLLKTVDTMLLTDLCKALDRRLPGRLTTAQKSQHTTRGIEDFVRIIGTCQGRSSGSFVQAVFTSYCLESLPSWMTKFRKNNEKFIKKLDSFCSAMSKYYAGVKSEWLQKYLQQ